MSVYSVWPLAGCLLIFYAFAATPALAWADAPPIPARNRVLTVDGLRGFLALAVFFHHASIYRAYIATGWWGFPPSRFYTSLGPLGVSVFFMITGYLFWSRLIREGSRTRWVQLYLGRVFRIGPLYVAAVAVMVLLVFWHTHFALREAGIHVYHELIAWFSLGLLVGHDVNLYPGSALWLVGVTWSIQWEWFFYLSLPLLAVLVRLRRLQLPAVALALGAILLNRTLRSVPASWHTYDLFVALFLCGMLAASLAERGFRPKMSDRQSSLLVVVALGLVQLFPTVYAPGPILLLGVSFFLITHGCSLLGLLLTRPARRMGDISYGIYLLQGLALATIFRPPPLQHFILASALHYWMATVAAGLLLLVLATIAHVAIERPGIAAGRWIAKALEPAAP